MPMTNPPMTNPSFKWLYVPVLALSPCWAWAQSAPEKATITLEVADRTALEAALSELQSQGVIRASKIDYTPAQTSGAPATTDRIVAERILKKPDAVRIEVELSAIRYDADGKGVFTTSTGTVWRETVASPVRSRLDSRRAYKGVITSGLMGGFRLNIEGVVRELKVEPIRAP